MSTVNLYDVLLHVCSEYLCLQSGEYDAVWLQEFEGDYLADHADENATEGTKS